MAKVSVGLTRAEHYMETAKSLRERALTLKVEEARDALHAIAADYERLADFVQPIKPVKTYSRPQIGPRRLREPVLAESERRSRVLQRVEDGRLPVMLSTNICAGYGRGIQCDLCDKPIAAGEIEYDVIDPRGVERLHFHIACHLAWQRECAVRLRNFRDAGYQYSEPQSR